MKASSLVLALATLAALTHAAEPIKADGFTHVGSAGGIDEYRLDANGLQVLLYPEDAAPVATFMVTYRVGSRNEVTGTTGATHLLEHLMFKGTKSHDRSTGNSYDQLLERVGAETNATTWLDRTNYFATVPTNALPLLIELESDRMRNLALREEDRKPEMTVVRNEFERGENSPVESLNKELWASAFIAHPYHHETIGWRSDIERVPIEKLRAFYDTFYWPDNATVTVIGSFDPAATLAEIKKRYGAIPRAPHPFPQIYTEEPPQRGQRRVTLKRPGEVGLVALAHKIPAATHADWPALQMMSAILTNGRTSRCYKALSDKNLTINVDSFPSFNHDPSLHLITAELAPEVKHDVVEKELHEQITKLQKDGVTAAEMSTALAGLLARRTYMRDGSFAMAAELNECIAVGDWRLYADLGRRLAAVTAEDVKRVAATYLVDDHSVCGWFVPTAETEPAAAEDASAPTFESKKVMKPGPLPTKLNAVPAAGLAKRVRRTETAGIDLLVCPTPVKGMAHLSFSLPAGESKSPNRALAWLTAGMLEHGTTEHDQYQLADLLEGAGVAVEQRVTADTVEMHVKCLSKDIPLVISLIAEELRKPAFAAEELEKLKVELTGAFQQSQEDTDRQAIIAFQRGLHSEGHPSRPATTAQMISALRAATVADVRAFHAANYGPTNMHLAAVGDVDPQSVAAAVQQVFAGWSAQPARPAAALKDQPAAKSETHVDLPGKASVSVVIGQTDGLRAGDPDWLALRVGTDVLGQGFTSRLVGSVRDREGLTYGITAHLDGDTERAGSWIVQGTFAPSLLAKGLTSTRREIREWWSSGITEDELDYRKTATAGRFAISLETTGGLAAQLIRCVERGFPISWLDEFPAKVNALTLDEVNAAIRKHLDPERMITVKAGTPEGPGALKH